jgi:hypothetical protein
MNYEEAFVIEQNLRKDFAVQLARVEDERNQLRERVAELEQCLVGLIETCRTYGLKVTPQIPLPVFKGTIVERTT